MKELNHVVMETSEFQHPPKSKFIALFDKRRLSKKECSSNKILEVNS